MVFSSRFFRLPGWPALRWGALLLALAAPLAAETWQKLLGNSPFGSPKVEAVETPAANFEFRGFVQEGDVHFFNIYDPTQKKSHWLTTDTESNGLKVEQFNSSSRQLVLAQGGRQITLPLKEAKVTLKAIQPPSPLEPPTPSGAISPEEKNNLQKIAEEIRRRRALRSQTELNVAPEKETKEE